MSDIKLEQEEWHYTTGHSGHVTATGHVTCSGWDLVRSLVT